MRHTFHNSLATIDLGILRENAAILRGLLPDGVKLLSVVKADAYGHGAARCALVLDTLVDWFAVASVDEGIELRMSGVRKPILILGVPEDRTAAAFVSHNLTATISHPSHFSVLMDGTRYQINIDTGMRRLGITPDHYREVRTLAVLNQRLICSGIYSHYATADDPDSPMTELQHERFEHALREFPEIPLRHISNASGLLYHDLPLHGMVRVGLPMWGYLPGDPAKAATSVLPRHRETIDRLRKVLTWRSSIVQTRPISKGESVSYGATWVAPEDGFISTVPTGYADGIRRGLSGRLKVLVFEPGNDDPLMVPVVGRITMDYVMLYHPDRPLNVGSTVEFIGNHGMDASVWANDLETIPYEILTGITRRVPREYLRDGGVQSLQEQMGVRDGE